MAAAVLAGCGDDESDTEETAAETTAAETTTETATTEAETSATTEAAGEAVTTQDIVACLEDLDHDVIVNPGSIAGAKNFLVDAGFGGVLYVFDDEAAAEAGEAKVVTEESGTGRDAQVLGNVVIAYMTQREVPDLEECAQP
jgi:hypothetical protein